MEKRSFASIYTGCTDGSYGGFLPWWSVAMWRNRAADVRVTFNLKEAWRLCADGFSLARRKLGSAHHAATGPRLVSNAAGAVSGKSRPQNVTLQEESWISIPSARPHQSRTRKATSSK
jgi:hypothetical protein